MEQITMQSALDIAARRRELTEQLKKVLIERLSLPMDPEDITEDSPLFGAGLGLDSVDALEIAVAVETEFGVSITEDDMSAFRSINTVVDFIQEKQSNRN